MCLLHRVSKKTGAGQLCFNGGGEMNFMGLPNFSARVLEQNINAANDLFVGGKSNKKKMIVSALWVISQMTSVTN